MVIPCILARLPLIAHRKKKAVFFSQNHYTNHGDLREIFLIYGGFSPK